jgi:hypothetical protein
VRRAMEFCLAVVALMLLGYARAQPTDHPQSTGDSLRLYAVNIGTNYGVYLGNGLVITAAHVLGSASHTEPIVRIAGTDLPAKIIRKGPYELMDLMLLSVDEQKLPIYLRMRRMPLCVKAPWVGEPVIVAIPEGTARSRIMSPRLLPPAYRLRFSTVISDVATTGNSGSGVFDAGQKCLLGIMSRKIFTRADAESEPKDIAKYFVPASTIGKFRPSIAFRELPPASDSVVGARIKPPKHYTTHCSIVEIQDAPAREPSVIARIQASEPLASHGA